MHVYRSGTSTSTEHGQTVVEIQIQFGRAKRRSHLSSNETFVLLISSIPKIPSRLTVAKAPRIANRHRPPKMDANHVYCMFQLLARNTRR